MHVVRRNNDQRVNLPNLEEKRHTEQRAEETQMTEEARGISSIDPDYPRLKVLD